jgi:REP element-mobilizing transposase RayT
MERFLNPLVHGGNSRRGLRKIARPVVTGKPMHVVLKSSRARGAWSFWNRRNKGTVHLLVLDTSERYGIDILKWENVGNHLHFVLTTPSRKAFQAFLRVLAQRIMFAVTGARKGNPAGKFFDQIAWSRVAEWSQLRVLFGYIWKNTLEALGFGKEEIRRFRRQAKETPI